MIFFINDGLNYPNFASYEIHSYIPFINTLPPWAMSPVK